MSAVGADIIRPRNLQQFIDAYLYGAATSTTAAAAAAQKNEPIPPQKTKNSSRFAFETAAVIILLYRISDVILDYVIETGVNVVALAPDGRAPFAGYCVEIVVLYVCALEARLAADDIPVGGVCSVAAALI